MERHHQSLSDREALFCIHSQCASVLPVGQNNGFATMSYNDTPPGVPFALTQCIVSFPGPKTLLLLINRTNKLNSLTEEANYELDRVFRWFDNEPKLLVAIISGAGKTFCVGADLHGPFCHLTHSEKLYWR